MNAKDFALDLIEFLHQGSSAYQAVEETARQLKENGYRELTSGEEWTLQEGDKVYFIKNGTALFAARIGEGSYQKGFHIIGSHSDSPGFRIKPNCEMLQDGYMKLNTEVYGGPILNTWLDRPLSAAGRVSLKGEHPMTPKMQCVDFKRPLVYIPNAAIHMNREVNKGFELNRQQHVLPVMGLTEEKQVKDFFRTLLAKELAVSPEDILDYELYLYETAKGELVGVQEEFISSKRMDNLSMAHASLKALTETQGTGIKVFALYDNEEVGSRTKQGAGSLTLAHFLERLVLGLGADRKDYLEALDRSFLISADLAHAVHPNFTEYADPTNRPRMNQGPVIKIAANQSYTSDASSTAVFMGLCQAAQVPCQTFVNRSDKSGGSTIGPISAQFLPIASVDIGNAILGMHSIREFAGVQDHFDVYRVFKIFYDL